MRKRNCRVVVYLTKDELEDLRNKVRKSGLSREGFLRKIIRGAEVMEAPQADVRKLIREMRRVGNNINQILVRINSQNILDLVQFRKDMKDLREVIQLVIDEYAIEKR